MWEYLEDGLGWATTRISEVVVSGGKGTDCDELGELKATSVDEDARTSTVLRLPPDTADQVRSLKSLENV